MYKSKRIRIIALVLGILFIGTFAAACGNKNTDADRYKIPKNPAEFVEQESTFVGKHDVSVKTTDIDFIKDGANAGYSIVVPMGDNAVFDYNAAELNHFFNLAAGITFPVIGDDEAIWSPNAKYLSIGVTSLLDSAGVTLDIDTLGNSGFIIKTVGNSVFMSGAGGAYNYGSTYCVQDFMKHTIGYEYYDENAIYYNKNITNLKLPDFDITEVPDFEWRHPGYGQMVATERSVANYRRQQQASFFASLPDGKYINHSMEYFVPLSEYGTQHPKWFSHGKTHCYLAGGDEDEFDAFTSEMVNITREAIRRNPDAIAIQYGQEDSNDWCNCDACRETKAKYGGADSSTQIIWLNEVARKCEEQLFAPGKEFAGKKFMISMFSYTNTFAAPAKKNADGEFVPIDEKVVFHPNATIYFAPINSAFQYASSDMDKNKLLAETMLGWRALIKHDTFTWWYDTYFPDFFAFYNSFDAMQQKFKDAKEFGSVFMYNQAQVTQSVATGFCNLKMYLESKLLWNVNSDYSELINNYFDNYFGEASEPMRDYFEQLRIRLNQIQTEPSFNEYVMFDIKQDRYWQEGLLDSWLKCIDQAYAKIEHLKETNFDAYRLLHNRILLESINVRYMLIDLYGGSRYSQEELLELKREFRNDCDDLGISHYSEHGLLSEFWPKWGI